jgi:hypothetical protein
MSETDRHHLKFDSPHIYKCSCGFVVFMHPDGKMKVSEKPRGRIVYLPCGHAACAKTEQFDCYICAMRG